MNNKDVREIDTVKEIHEFKTNFFKSFLKIKRNFSKISNKNIRHGIEIEGFFLNKDDLKLNPYLTKKILKEDNFNLFQDELGNAQLEYCSDSKKLLKGSYYSLLKDIKFKRSIVKEFAENNKSYFITKGIPPFLDYYPESNLDNFNNKEVYKLEEKYWNFLTKDNDSYKIKKSNGKIMCEIYDDNKSLAFVNGIHINIQPIDKYHCKDIFNTSLNLIPFLSGLASNGGFLNEELDKKDYRLHIGMLDENLLNDNYVYDTGMPDFYIEDIEEYFYKHALKDPIYHINRNSFFGYIESHRETSWSFIQIKALKDNLIVEYRPISTQLNSNQIASFHIYSILLIEYCIEKNIILSNIDELHADLKKSLKYGVDSIINFNNKKYYILDLFENLINPIKSFSVNKGYVLEEEYDEIIKNIYQKIDKEYFYNKNILEYIKDSHNDLD